ncbi:MAG: class I SAM-dependent methyltransferase [Gemmatimonadaceae bacterium]
MYNDYFSAQAAAYASYRPPYPATLFAFLATLAPRHDAAWDCATGNGQAAIGLAEYFAHVVATDASMAQLERARPHPHIEYRQARAESSGIGERAIDLVTVAQALHWLDLTEFYREVRRVLRPAGAIAVWSYGDPVLDDPTLSGIVEDFNLRTLAAYWPAQRGGVGEAYRSMPFPFQELAAPTFVLEANWTVTALAGYVRSWSATARFVATHGRDPVGRMENALCAAWGDPAEPRLVRWPITLRAGRVN